MAWTQYQWCCKVASLGPRQVSIYGVIRSRRRRGRGRGGRPGRAAATAAAATGPPEELRRQHHCC
ncbi:hypothetical protein CHLRE_16g686789v5 [Chlamydomonas reinhardtii]|uniref:Uncharacterized protein n=1 Tax=Chlamydomonas reinhardtii TaxID=3055 RepID=A0A2K3CUQ0_CHLRE|nr:uncharacterized protein CHLRE_16g686789v5 [Chlamydomonas reinhardtii]PNW71996.1 hypothetical protein CHLRE_16g686789v5 [Chlamydomonas reinhardtii]